MAEHSYNRRVIGDLAWALGVIPVKRQQDEARVGTGLITITAPKSLNSADTEMKIEVKGDGTAFTKELSKGDKIRPPDTAIGLKVASVENDTLVMVEIVGIPDDYPFPTKSKFDILKRTDTKVVFGKVVDRLAEGGAVGIFPEGGSHDRTDLLPLKIGVTLIAYSALENDGLNVPIIPVGLSYFGAHRWGIGGRGRVVVEYGRPITIDPNTLPDYKAGGAKVSSLFSRSSMLR